MNLEKLALEMLLRKEKFINLYNSKKESDKIRAELYIKQYVLYNYDFLVELSMMYKELDIWKEIIKVIKNFNEKNHTEKSVSNSKKSTKLTYKDLGTTNLSY